MVLPANSIIQDINNYISQHGGGYSAWYVGIASDPKDRLFNEHNVDQHNGAWIYKDAGSETEARRIEKHFLSLGCDGGTGGGDYSTRYVYAYKKTYSTNP